MGWRNVRLVYAIGRAIKKPRDKSVLTRLAESASDEDGTGAYPSVDTIAREGAHSVRSVQYALQSLVDDGWIFIESPAGVKRRTVTYALSLAKLSAAAAAKPAPRTGAQIAPQGCTDCTPRVHTLHPKGARVAPDLYLSSSLEALENETGADAPARVEHTKRHDGIAKLALQRSLQEDQTDSFANVAEIFKQECARQGVPYDADVTRKVVESALAVHAKKRHGEFVAKLSAMKVKAFA